MTKTELRKEYSKTMQEAEHASGRRETLNLYKKARLIKKELINKGILDIELEQ